MTSNKETVTVSQTLLTMFAKGYSGNTSYYKLYHAILNGKVPSEVGANGRPRIRSSDFPTVAAVLGLKPPAPSNSIQRSAETEHASL